MKPGIIAPIFFMLLTSGCQLVKHISYDEPTEGELATLTFTSNETAAQPVVCVPGKGFQETFQTVSAYTGSDEGFIADMNTAMNKAASVSVKIDASSGTVKTGLRVRQKPKYGAAQYCKVAAQFSVTAGGEYAVHLNRVDNHCGLTVTNQGEPVEDAVVVPWHCE